MDTWIKAIVILCSMGVLWAIIASLIGIREISRARNRRYQEKKRFHNAQRKRIEADIDDRRP